LKSTLITTRNIFYLNILISIFLVTAILLFTRDIVSLYFEKENPLKRDILPFSKDVINERKMQLMDYVPILKNNPFGFPGGELKPLTAASRPGSPTQAHIVLIGTVVGPKALSYAVFRDSAGLQEVFKIGDSVFGMGELSRVEKEKVIIDKGGTSFEVPIEDVRVKEIDKQSSAASPSLSSFAQRVGRGTYVVDQGKLQQVIANPGQMMTDARLKPNFVSGKEEGFMLSEVKPGGIYQSLGLQNGDVLLRINEYDISNPERALQAFTALKGLDRVQIDLIRAGAKMTMTYQIK
jgi:general secretion pathway protein C